MLYCKPEISVTIPKVPDDVDLSQPAVCYAVKIRKDEVWVNPLSCGYPHKKAVA